jgi:hypothetical protein
MNKKQIEEIINPLGIYFTEKDSERPLIKVYSNFNANEGYFFINENNSEYLLIKAIHKDFIRILKGEPSVSEKNLSKISDIAAQIDRNIDNLFCIYFQINETPELVDIDVLNRIDKPEDMRNPLIKKPLSQVEYNLSKDNLFNDKLIYFRGLTSSLFPETLSVFTASIFNRIPDVINPFFTHAGFKTHSPSIRIIFNKLYTNYSNIDLIFRTLKIDESFLKLCYAPHLYTKTKKPKILVPNMKLLGIELDEINEFIDEIEERGHKLVFEDLSNDNLSELIALITMCGAMIFFLTANSFLGLRKILSSWSETLCLIYKSRENSIFKNTNNEKFIEYFDFFSDVKEISFKNIETSSIDELIKELPAKQRLFNKSSILKLIKEGHIALDLRDRLFIQTNKILLRVKEILNKIGEDLVSERKFKKIEDISYFEIDEIKNIVDDNFFGNIPFTKSFKYWQLERFKAQIMPNEIYEKDIDSVYEITNMLYPKIKDMNEFEAVSYFHQDRELENSQISLNRDINFTNINLLEDKKAIITESTSIFSFLTEYACLTDKPIYTGIRYAPLILKDKKIIFSENKIKTVN